MLQTRIITTNLIKVSQMYYHLSGSTFQRSLSSTVANDEVVFESRIEVPTSSPQHKAIISVINLNDSKAKNALSKKSVYKIMEILHKLQYYDEKTTDNSRVRALILRSNVSGIFCAGANLKERQAMSKGQVELWLKVQRSLMDNLSDFSYPTIAAIDGHALGGGLELALACDIRIVNEKAKVGLVETKLAIIPGAGGTQRLARLIGVGKAKEHIFVAEPIDGTEATRLGIANHLATGENGSFDKAVELAMKICKRGPKALRLAKAAIDSGCQTSLDTGLDIENAYYGQLLDSSDRTEGLKAFSEKREPLYTVCPFSFGFPDCEPRLLSSSASSPSDEDEELKSGIKFSQYGGQYETLP